jgi:hypothetical protein
MLRKLLEGLIGEFVLLSSPSSIAEWLAKDSGVSKQDGQVMNGSWLVIVNHPSPD